MEDSALNVPIVRVLPAKGNDTVGKRSHKNTVGNDTVLPKVDLTTIDYSRSRLSVYCREMGNDTVGHCGL